VLAAAGAGVAFVMVAMPSTTLTDYSIEAEPAVQALRDGRLSEFGELAPSYGGSLLLRAPFAVLPDLWGGGDLALFRSMAIPCLAAAVFLGLMLWQRSRVSGAGRGAAWLVLLLCVANPITLRALRTGHPEELLGAVLCVGAVLAGGARRPILAGALLGLAVANKPWAVLAAVPLAVALGGRTARAGATVSRWRVIATDPRLRAAAVAGVVGAAVLAPLALHGGAALQEAGTVARSSGEIFKPWQVWWFAGDHAGPLYDAFGDQRPAGYRTPPAWLGQVARPLVILVPVLLSVVCAIRLRRRPWHDALLLLALVFLLRCVLDPWNVSYYALPFLFALLAWEVHARGGLPRLTLLATLLTWVTAHWLRLLGNPDVEALAYVAWSVPFAAALAWRLLDPHGFGRRLHSAEATFRLLVRARPPRTATETGS
jgi:Glycosyltransferase family 87